MRHRQTYGQGEAQTDRLTDRVRHRQRQTYGQGEAQRQTYRQGEAQRQTYGQARGEGAVRRRERQGRTDTSMCKRDSQRESAA